jgi:hypothetical protein
MKRFYVAAALLSTILLASLTVFAQTQSREDRLKEIEAKRKEIADLEAKLLEPSDKDRSQYAEFLKSPDTGLIRLLPREKYDTAAYPPGKSAPPAAPGAFQRKSMTDLSNDLPGDLPAGQPPRGGGGVPRQNSGVLNNLDDLPRSGEPDTRPTRHSVTIRGGGSYYSFTRRTHEYNSSPDIQLDQRQLSSGFAGANYGLLKNIGDVPLESVDLTTHAVTVLAAYTPPEESAQARSEKRRFEAGAEIDGVKFRRRVPLNLHSTYLLRSVNYALSDVLVAFKVVDIDSDGSAIILWKLLKTYPTPRLAQK